MLSNKTNLILASIIEAWTTSEIDRLLIHLNMQVPAQPNGVTISKSNKVNYILTKLNANGETQKEVMEFLLIRFKQRSFSLSSSDPFSTTPDPRNIEEQFNEEYQTLLTSLHRDGYTVRNLEYTSLLPEELIETDTENELFRLLNKYEFTTEKGHLEQAIENHSLQNWAGANAQFRPFLESLLMSICNKLTAPNRCNNYGEALQWMANTSKVNPVFLSPSLNEVPSQGGSNDKTYVSGLMNRLHPQGPHPGLSDEEDSTFRYHTVIIFARYLLKRLEDRFT
ncbi:hypothetical protein [Bacteroides fragilis]|uniref:hypothetical protein n=1 Tax=Bacteroides fragilis TaxID=817 RepID=UPI0018CB6BE9|nr:hypothetical protein [Bacteroides fragilis]MBG9213029.1 hypothetical protein [Bacteroides fragilis]MBG9226213.1 hypothetical protein [Bacteroides fragilis]